MKYKAVAIDMDGTLLNDKYEITVENVKVLKRLNDKGIKIFIVTGRMYQAVIPYFKVLGFKNITVCYNGAKIYDENENVIYKKELKYSKIKNMLDFRKINSNKEITPLFFINDELVAPKYDDNVKEYEERTSIECKIIENILDRDFITTKVVFSSENYKLLDNIKEKLLKYNEIYVTRSKLRYLEMLDKNVSKGEAIKFLCEKLNINLEDFVVIGDNNNDIKMFLPQVYKVAMKNGDESLKKIADFITETNNNNGVALALKKIFGV